MMNPNTPNPRLRIPSKAGMVFATLLIAFALMACSLFSKPAALLPQTGAMVTQAVGQLSSTLQAGVQAGAQAADDTPTPAVTAQVMNYQGSLPRSFKYNDLTFSLQNAVITSQAPEGINPNTSDPNSKYALTVWKVSNPTTQAVSVRQGVFTLKLAEDIKATQAYEDTFNSQETRIVKINFTVPANATWDKAKISFTEPDKEPADLPLDGDVPVAKYPQALTAGGQAQVSVPALIYQVQEASVDLDGMGQRAGENKEFLLFKVQATCKDKYDCYVGPESFRVLVDGTPYSATKIDPAADAVKVDNSQVFRLAFEIPDEAKQVILQVGEAGKGTAQIPVNLENDK